MTTPPVGVWGGGGACPDDTGHLIKLGHDICSSEQEEEEEEEEINELQGLTVKKHTQVWC